MFKNKNNLITIVSLVVITAIITFTISAFVFVGWDNLNPFGISFDKKAINQEEINKFGKVWNTLKSEYYQNVDEKAMMEGAIAGMVGSLGDRYTSYYTKEQWQMLEEDIEGSFLGIGVNISVGNDGILTIVDTMNDSPAKAAGIKGGDKIVKVDGKDVTKDPSDIVIGLIRKKENPKVTVTVLRPSEEKYIDFTMVKKKVKEENLKSEVLESSIGYIKISKFDGEIANYFNSELDKLLKKNIKGLIIDLRDDPGGYYSEVVAIADRLLPKCTIVYTEDKYKKREFQYSDSKELKLPLVLLVNGNSASASEILSGAIKDNKKGKLIGTKTFGKGLVQAPMTLSDGSGLKVTIQRYFTPSGVCIQGKGIQPDVEVQVGKKYENLPVSQIPKEDDLQLLRGISEIKSEISK